MAASTFSKNTRLARALAVVSSAVAPTSTPSTMMGPLKPTLFSFANTVLKSTLPVPNCDITSAFGNTYSILDRIRDGVDRVVTAPEITASGIAGAKAGIIGNFDACKLLVWGIETVWNPYVYADQFKTKVTINVLMNAAISLPSAFIGWNQN